jgi:hypothetical protein
MMKKFSKMLIALLFVMTICLFGSCKDYDDDINSLQKQIDQAALKSEVTSMSDILSKKIDVNKKTSDSAFAVALAKIGETKNDFTSALNELSEYAHGVGTQTGEAIVAVNRAQSTADDALSAAQDAAAAAEKAYTDAKKDIAKAIEDANLSQYAKDADVKTLTETVNTMALAMTDLATAEQLKFEIDSIGNVIDEKIAENIEQLRNELTNVDYSISAIWKAVTSIELYAGNGAVPGQKTNLLFFSGKKIENLFGADSSPNGNVVRSYGKTDKIIEFKGNEDISFDNRILVRVNPVNATFDTEDVVLINSLGESLDDYVEVKSIESYNQLITRGQKYETGLKVLTIARKAGVTDDQLATAVSGKKIDGKNVKSPQTGDATFALGINCGDDRFVYSTFDITISYGDYTPVRELDFAVKGDADADYKNIAVLKNRWNNIEGKIIDEAETKESPKAGSWNAEMNWDNLDKDVYQGKSRATLDTMTVGGIKNFNTLDSRINGSYVLCDKNTRTFTINPVSAIVADNWDYIQYYYVVLDRFAAVDYPSEIRAWDSYSYTGLNVMTPATDKLNITVDSENAIGDIIGFRLIAVNYDGSLVDPDGRAFYVKIGDVNDVKANKTVTFTAYNNTAMTVNNIISEVKNSTGAYNVGIVNIDINELGFTSSATFTQSGTVTLTPASYPSTIANNATLTWVYLKADNTLATSWSNVSKLAVGIDKAGSFYDNGSVSFTLTSTDPDHHNATTNKLTVKVTKTFPTTVPSFSWKTGYGPVGGVKYFYPMPTTAYGWTYPTTTSVQCDMMNYVNNHNGNYSWTFWTDNSKETDIADITQTIGVTNAYLRFPLSYVETENNTVYGEYDYVYTQTSCKNANDVLVPNVNKNVNVFSGNVVFDDIILKNTYSVKPYTYYTDIVPVSGSQPSATSTVYAYQCGNDKLTEYYLGITAGTADPTNVKAASTYSNLNLSSILTQRNNVMTVFDNVPFDKTLYTAGTVKVGQNNDYLTATYDAATSQITFTKVATPLTKLTQTVTVKLTDKFNNVKTISFDIVIVPTTVAAGNLN